MYLVDAFSVLENSDSEGFHNIIVNIFDLALLDSKMPLPRAIPQLEPNIFLKFDVSVALQVHIPQSVVSVSLCPITEFLRGSIFCCSESPLVPRCFDWQCIAINITMCYKRD